jgi:UDP-N-acetylglucosamine diphosphorylase/glucosamine-1-phosphate N-acetyltransferase
MPRSTLILFDDAIARGWEPFALTRPAGELLFGTMTLRERAERVFGTPCAFHLSADHLRGFEEEGAPPVATLDAADRDVDRIFFLSRAVPELGTGLDRASDAMADGDAGAPGISESGPIVIQDRVVGWVARAGDPAPTPDQLLDPAASDPGNGARLPGRVLRNVWDLIGGNDEQIAADVEALHADARQPDLPAGVHCWGDHPVVLEDDVALEPGCALDASAGPIWLARGVTVRAFTRLAGPAYIGRDTQLLGGSIESISTGPVCKLRGELSVTVCLGYTNKQHDGHMGHAYLGRWVNLGAETTNSDLKNNYGTIRMWTPAGDTDTGEMKLGCLLGDHVKTGIGLLLNTGTVVGAGSNLYGAAMPPKFVPPFSWGTGEELIEYRLEKFLEVAEVAMGRRGVTLSEDGRKQLSAAWERGRAEWGTRSGEGV